MRARPRSAGCRVRGAALALLLCGCRAPTPVGPPAQRVVVAYASGAQALRPHLANDEYTSSILGNVFEPLVALDGELGLQPGLAESWLTPDDLTWVFRLRPGVRFHDGTPLEARHVVAALEQARSDPASQIRSELAPVSSFEAEDARTVVVRTRQRCGALLNRLCMALVFKDPPAGSELPLGTGPFRLVRRGPDGSVVLSAFDGYRGGAPALRELEFRVLPRHEEQLAGLERGELQLISEVQPAEVLALRQKPALRVVSRSGLLVQFLAFDCAHAESPHVACPKGPCNPLRDVRVRRALAAAIDKDALVIGPLGGLAETVAQVVAPEAFGADRALQPPAYDLEQARGLLRAAGFASGFELTLDYLDEDARADDALVAALAKDLAQVGVRLVPRANDLPSMQRRIASHDGAVFLMPWIGTSGDFGSTADYLLRTPGGGYGSHNGGGYSSAELDALLVEAETQVRPAARQRLLQAAGRRVHEDLPVLPLCRRLDLYATAAGLHFQPRLDRQVRGAELRWR